VLRERQADPFCGVCKAYANTLTAVRDNLAQFEGQRAAEVRNLPGEISRLLAEARSAIAALTAPENAVGQKKAGNCKLPEGVCFVKSSLAILQKV
jgi:hypothetical protein